MKVSIRKFAERAMRDSGKVLAKDARKISAEFAQLLIEAVQKGDVISIPEIGKLIVKTYAPRRIYCPLREQVILHDGFKAVRFSQYIASKKHAAKSTRK